MSDITTINTIPVVSHVTTVPSGNGSSPNSSANEPVHGTTIPERLSSPDPQPFAEPLTPQRRGRWWRRSLVFATISIVIAVFLVSWADYRISHVVARQAVVKGVVSQVGARIAGRVAQVMVQPNQRIHKGDVLAKLDNEHLKATVESVTADLARAKLEYEVAVKELKFDREKLAIEASLKERQVSAAAADVNQAQALSQRWKRERERIDQLKIPGVVTGSEKDEIISQDESKSAALAATKERLEEARLDRILAEKAIDRLTVAEARLDVLRKDVDVAQANLKSAQADLEATEIRAPQDGWVARQLVEEGGSVRVGDQIVALWAGDQLWIEAWVDESDLSDLKVGNPVDVYLAAYPNQVVPGRLEALGVLSDGEFLAAALPRPISTANNSLLPVPTNVAVRISVMNQQIRLMPGLTAVVGIHSGYRNPARQWLPTSVSTSITSTKNYIVNIADRLLNGNQDHAKVAASAADPTPNMQVGTQP